MDIAGRYGAAVRSFFPETVDCRAEIDGAHVALERLSVRSMNFGQHWRTDGIEEVSYCLELPRSYLVVLAALTVPELVADARRYPDPDNALEAALRDAGYFAVEAAAAPAVVDARTFDREPLATLLVAFLAHDALVQWLGDGLPEAEPGFVLNSIDSLALGRAHLTLGGRARRTGMRVRYQDV